MAKDKKMNEELESENQAMKSGMVAKKDFELYHNEYHRKIKAGDDISDIPSMYHENLKTEGVL